MIEMKIITTKNAIYKIYYKLYKNNENFYLYIKSEKKQCRKNKAIQIKIAHEKLPFKSKKESYGFFYEVVRNLVFPHSLTYILEDIK